MSFLVVAMMNGKHLTDHVQSIAKDPTRHMLLVVVLSQEALLGIMRCTDSVKKNVIIFGTILSSLLWYKPIGASPPWQYVGVFHSMHSSIDGWNWWEKWGSRKGEAALWLQDN